MPGCVMIAGPTKHRQYSVQTSNDWLNRLTMTRQDLSHVGSGADGSTSELVLYCNVRTEKAVYKIQSGLTSAGFYRNRKKARKVLETRNKAHKENGVGGVYERSVSGQLQHLYLLTCLLIY